MKRNLKITAPLVGLALSLALPAWGQEFSTTSPLKEGKWVKIFVDRTGLYELSYEQLREMGFENPSKVAVLGKGGPQLSLDFTTAAGETVYSDMLQSVGVIDDTEGEKIYFFGQGTQNVDFGLEAASSKRRFLNRGQNIYSRVGAYFLTDSQPRKKIAKKAKSNTFATALENGAGYILHDLDLIQSNHHDGQLFWGEDFTKYGAESMEWDARHPDMLPLEAQLHLVFYNENWLDSATSYEFGMTGAQESMSNPFSPMSGDYYSPSINKVLSLTPMEGGGDVFLKLTGERPEKACHLDYWMLTFKRGFPSMPQGYAQDMIWFPSASEGIQYSLPAPEKDGVRVLQVTDPFNVTELGQGAAANTLMLDPDANVPSLLYFDPSRPQLEIKGYERIENQNLHAIVEEDPELLIITLPHLRELAERHADVHRRLEGMRVSVATAPEIYNEFSAGVPDAMAYRALVTYLHQNQKHPLKNLLLYGPQLSDLRGLTEEIDPSRYLIAIQDTKNHYDNGGYPDYDIYGCVAGAITQLPREQAPITVGVGILSVRDQNDAEIIRKKVENYILDNDFSGRINRFLSIGGAGDSHIHDSQAIAFEGAFNEMAQRGGISTVMLIDTYGGDVARDKFTRLLDEGVLTGIYFGHSTAYCLSAYEDFLSTAHLQNLHNTKLPFLCLAGCDQTLPDRNTRGIAEALVLDTNNGAIGVIGSTRSAWSGQNMEMFKAFYRLLNGTSPIASDVPLQEVTPTVGEIYASLKSYLKVTNELSFILAADPALRIPIIGRKAVGNATELNAEADEVVEVTGRITRNDGETDTDFNGDVTIRLMEPTIYLTSTNSVSNDTNPIQIPYPDRQASMASAEVKNGEYRVSIHVPSSMGVYDGQQLRLVAGAYDPEKKMGAAGEQFLTVSLGKENGNITDSDSEAPLISSIEYDAERGAIIFEASDNKALDFSTGSLLPGVLFSLDGRYEHGRISIRPGDGSRSARYEALVGELPVGEHRSLVSVADAAGNRAEADLVFHVSPIWGEIGLEMLETAADGQATFNVSGAVDNSLTLVILDAEGHRVFSTDSASDTILWDCRDSEGRAVTPGRYRAYVVESGDAPAKGSSKTLTFSVI